MELSFQHIRYWLLIKIKQIVSRTITYDKHNKYPMYVFSFAQSAALFAQAIGQRGPAWQQIYLAYF